MSRQVGLWMIGAHGGVSTTVAIGLAALKQNLIDRCGLVSERPEFGEIGLVDFTQIVLGGHEIRKTSCYAELSNLAQGSRAFDRQLLDSCRTDLETFDANIRPGIIHNVGSVIEALADKQFVQTHPTPRHAINSIQLDIEEFVSANKIDQLIDVNLASTEPPFDSEKLPTTWAELKPQLESSDCDLPASSLNSIAALESGFPFVNFTPSVGSCPPAIAELAVLRNTCHAGCDGKTGETFLKSVLARAFANRNLDIMSWVGHNIFGNMDGQVLDNPVNKQTKVASKDQLLGQVLGYDPQTHVSIEYIKSLGDWKTAWDHIHFRGFLGTPMVMTFTWQGCDSILAAPLVLDLFRFTELATRRGETGMLIQLSSFFKSPLGTDENDFAKQFQMLIEWALEAPVID